VKEGYSETEPTSVPKAKQAGEIWSRWGWVERCVWTERMLTALEKGVKGGKWFSLIDKVSALDNLQRAFAKVKANDGAAGADHQTIEMFEKDLTQNLAVLSQPLKEGSYRPWPVRREWIDKPGSKEKRPLGIPTVRDRVVQTALRNVWEPIFERDFAEHSYGFRPKRGCKDALRRVQTLLKEGYNIVVDADIKSYFDTIPRTPLMERVEEKISDGRVLELIQSYLNQGVMEGLKYWTPEEGTPQGAVISPLLANIYLDPLDKRMASKGFEMVRYADDFIVLCKTEQDAQQALAEVKMWMQENGLQLHPTKTRIVNAAERGGFDFLGYHFERGKKWPRNKSLKKIKDKVRKLTKRTNGHSLSVIISKLNPVLRGWFAYYKHSSKSTFRGLDGWTRMRLRSILRKRRRRRGRARNRRDHQRWPNAFFAKQGLFSLLQAHATA